MSRGRGGGRGGGRGRGRGGGGGGGGGPQIPTEMFGDISSMFQTKEPPALFPEYDTPIPRKLTFVENEQIQLIRAFRQSMKTSQFYLESRAVKKDIQRYSDKYRISEQKRPALRTIKTDLKFFPEELHQVINPTKASKGRKQVKAQFDINALDNLEQEEQKGAESEEKEEEEGKEGEEEEEEYDEEEMEEENDYIESYFDNGEGDDIDDDDGEMDYF
ncbi:uncharacterized protein VTP21DRAFT_2451 [Calcarisporiella thermophila]|uniref:uncharacterized protein n=1 Tax=Calcarisporiella thermophila TaxID=911321 RepID=UPI00374287C1